MITPRLTGFHACLPERHVCPSSDVISMIIGPLTLFTLTDSIINLLKIVVEIDDWGNSVSPLLHDFGHGENGL